MGRPAARVGDPHICPMFDGLKPHVGGPVLPPGKPTVMIGGMPAATVSDRCLCASAPDVIIQGSASVVINGLPAARMGDATMHGGRIILGCPTVLIGDFGMATPDMITNMIDFRTERPGITQDTSRPYVLAGAGGSGGMAGMSYPQLSDLMQEMPAEMASVINQARTLDLAAELGAPTAKVCKM